MTKAANPIFYLLIILAAAAAVIFVRLPDNTLAAVSCEETQPVLIIDAGHGGADGGAVAADGTPEAEINLAIALKLEALADFCGRQSIMTRSDASLDYPAEAATLSQMKLWDQHERLALINSTANAVFLSIHQNKYSSAAPSGPQVFFGAVKGSETLAALIQRNLTDNICPDNRREADKIADDIYLMNQAKCRSVLVECGFLSNPEELSKLKTEEYQLDLSVVIMSSFLQYIKGYTL